MNDARRKPRKQIKASEAAEMLLCNPRTILQYIQDGKLKGVKKPGRTGAWLVYTAQVEELKKQWGIL